MPRAATAPPDPLIDERALVRTLKDLRALVGEEHLLELDNAAALTPLAYVAVQPSAKCGHHCLFQTIAPPMPAAVRSPLFQRGDAVDITGAEHRAVIASGVVTSSTPSGIVVEFPRPVEAERFPRQGVVRLRVDDNPYTLRLRAIELLVRERHALPWVGPVLAHGPVAPLADARVQPSGPAAPLTDSQQRALDGAAGCKDVFLIQGPPGTGKTTVISALVTHFVQERGWRVLLTSKGHRAIDNALDRLAAADMHVVRLGAATRVTGAGQDLLLSALLVQAEQDIPRRHHEERTRLERIARCLETAEPVFARLVRTDRGIDEAAQAIDQHTTAIDQAWADRLAALQQETARAVAAITATQDQGGSRHLEQHLLHCQEAETWLLQQRRFHYARADLVALRDHLAGLREDRYRLTLQAEAVLGDLAHLPTRADLPPLGTATPAEAVESLTHVRAGIRGARLALAASRSWAASITPPGILAELLVQTADVVAATAIGAASGREGGRTAALDYDVAIVDEAGQAQAMDLVVALSRARRVILVGDHQQLAPYVDEDLLRRATEKRLETSWLTKSLFELLWDRLPASHRVRLNTQFRMPESIARFLGRIFYEGDYGSTEAKRDLAPVSPLFQAPFVVIDTGDHPARWETARSPGYLNTYEAAVVARIAERLPASCRGAEGLGVIAPYGAQVTAIRRQLADVLRLAPDDAWLRENVATVDSFQGQERDVVIVSLTRSNTHGQVGFLRDLHRLNVTLSRARRQLIVLGDVSTLIAPGGGQQRQAFARVARELVAHARRQGEVLTAAELEARFHGA